MTAINPGRIALQTRIVLTRVGLISWAIALALLFGTATWILFFVNARDQKQQEHTSARVQEGANLPSAAGAAAQASVAEQNLRKFYDVLGDRTETEQNLKALFAIAAQTGLSLNQGEYQWLPDKNSSTARYQILLPVKGSYGAIRRFCEKTLLALPFASLDELSFKRESVSEDELDASLRFTLYLTAKANIPTLTMKPAKPLSPSAAVSQRSNGAGTRYASLRLIDASHAPQETGMAE